MNILGSVKKKVFLLLGILFFIIGVAGLFLPVVPGTDFLFLSALMFAKSSKRLHRRLMASRFGPAIRNYKRKQMTLGAKKAAVIAIAIGMGISIYVVQSMFAKYALAAVAILVMMYVWGLKTARR
ncbi:MAG: YbaN family protein [Candidatus Aenigmatarchaeota archaeon]|nr:MAG: YbaN family protein [Candidatus Aenigmarchaeota archaeon]